MEMRYINALHCIIITCYCNMRVACYVVAAVDDICFNSTVVRIGI